MRVRLIGSTLFVAALAAAVPASADDKKTSDADWLTERYSVELPEAQPVDPGRLITAQIDPERSVRISGQTVRDEDLGPVLRERFKSGRYDTIIFRGDERADFKRIMGLLDVAKTAGFIRVGLETEAAPAPGRSAPPR